MTSNGVLQYGDRAAREVSERVGGTVLTTAAMSALPLRVLADGQLWFNAANGTVYNYKSAAVASEGGIACTAGGRFIPQGIQKRTAVITHAELTEAANNTAQAVNVGIALPTGANVLFGNTYLATQFTGGSVATCVMGVGTATEPNGILNAVNVLSGTASAWYSAGGTAATRAHGDYSAKQLVATFTPDASHALAALTAGSITVEVVYAVP